MSGPRPTRRGIGAAATAVALWSAGLTLGLPVLRGLGGFALGAFVVALVPVLVRVRPVAERTVEPTRLERGDRATARLVIHNPRNQRQAAFTAIDRIAGTIVEVPVSALAPGATFEHVYEVPAARRGRLEVGPLSIDRADPLGLARSRTDLGDVRSLWVHPRRLPVKVVASGRLRHHHDGVPTDQPIRGSNDVRSLREYVPGDELRHVHARASARTGTLFVRELVDPVQPHCTVVLDNRPAALTADAFEEAVEVAASIGWSAVQEGHRVVLCTAEGDRSPAAERPDAMQPLLDRLAAVEQVPSADPVRALEAVARGIRGGWLVVVTGAADRKVLAQLRGMRGFDPVTVFDVSGWLETASAPGVTVIRGGTAAEAVGRWDRVARR